VLTSSHIATRLAAAGQLLVRSGIEIDRILESMVEDGATLSASLPSHGMFLSRLVSVDPVKQHIQLSCSDRKNANSALLASPSVVLRCNHRGARYAFSARRPCKALHGGAPAIELALPTQVLALLHGRAPKPMELPAQPQADCQVRMGVLAFDARLVDVSLDGRGFLLHDDVIPLCAGTRLESARIRRPGRAPLSVDIEVRQVIPVALPGGRRATRIGCRIVAAAGDLEELIGMFIIEAK
jgi:c-di-GMP-binding flagellar brake protein YcgR